MNDYMTKLIERFEKENPNLYVMPRPLGEYEILCRISGNRIQRFNNIGKLEDYLLRVVRNE